MKDSDFQDQLDLHIVIKCLEAVKEVVETASQNCEVLGVYAIYVSVACNILAQVTSNAHLEDGVDAEMQFREHFKFIKSITRKMIIANLKKET